MLSTKDVIIILFTHALRREVAKSILPDKEILRDIKVQRSLNLHSIKYKDTSLKGKYQLPHSSQNLKAVYIPPRGLHSTFMKK